MNKNKLLKLVVTVFLMVIPMVSFAATAKVFSGTITAINGTELDFKIGSGAVYTVQTPNVLLERRYGASMQLSEVLVGDKIQVTGVARPDNSIAAQSIRNMTLYAHTGTYSAKVDVVNTWNSSFTMVSKTYGTQTVHVNNLTALKINSSAASLGALQPGMSVSVKGVWDRTRTDLQAQTVSASFRLINIYFTGNLMVRGDTAFTIISPDHVMYAVDITHASLLSKNSKSMTPSQFNMDDTLRVWGKHVSGSNQVVATEVKDAMVSK